MKIYGVVSEEPFHISKYFNDLSIAQEYLEKLYLESIDLFNEFIIDEYYLNNYLGSEFYPKKSHELLKDRFYIYYSHSSKYISLYNVYFCSIIEIEILDELCEVKFNGELS